MRDRFDAADITWAADLLAKAAFRDLRELTAYYTSTRQAGHTTAVLRGAVATGASVLVATATDVREMERHGVRAYPISSLERGHLRRGPRFPLVVDHYAIQCMVTDAERRLEHSVGSVLREIWSSHE